MSCNAIMINEHWQWSFDACWRTFLCMLPSKKKKRTETKTLVECLTSGVFWVVCLEPFFKSTNCFFFIGSMPTWIKMPLNRKRLYFEKTNHNWTLNQQRWTTFVHQMYSFFFCNRPLLPISKNFYDFSMKSTVVRLSSRHINCLRLTTQVFCPRIAHSMW